MRLICLLFILLLSISSCPQQVQEYRVRDYPFENCDIIKHVARDKDGYLWFSTAQNGAFRFDGKNYVLFNSKQGFTNYSLSKIYPCSKGGLWFCTFKDGMYKYDGNGFRHFVIPGNPDLFDAAEGMGSLWAASHRGLFRINGKKFSEELTFKDEKILSIQQGPGGKIYLLTNKPRGPKDFLKKGFARNLYSFDGKNLRMIPLKNTGTNLGCFSFDSQGNLWLGYTGKVVRKKDNVWNEIVFTSKTDDKKVLEIAGDRDGNMWFRTNSGLYLCVDLKVKQVSSRTYSDFMFQDIYSDVEGNLWATARSKVKKFNRAGFTFLENPILPGNHLLFEDKKGKLWFFGKSTLPLGVKLAFSIYDGKNIITLPAPVKMDLAYHNLFGTEAEDGSHWFVANDKLLKLSGKKFTVYVNKGLFALSGKEQHSSRSISADSHGNVFIYYNSDQIIARFSGGKFSNYSFAKDRGNFYNYLLNVFHINYVYSGGNKIQVYDGKQFREIVFRKNSRDVFKTIIKNDGDNIIISQCLKNRQNVLEIINSRSGKISRVTAKDGLIEEDLQDFIVDRLTGDLWMFHDKKGFSRMNLREFYSSGKVNLCFYPYENVYESVIGRSPYQDSKGDIWLETIMGQVKFKPAYLKMPGITNPRIVLSGIKLFFGNHDVSEFGSGRVGISGIPKTLRLPYNENYITFEFSALSFIDPDETEYSFMLEGFDSHWSPMRQLNEASYTNLPPGTYTFLARARLKNRIYTNTIAYTFTIAPPFWNTWWFILLSISAGVALVYFIIRFRMNKNQARKLEELVNMRTRQLREEMEKVEFQNSVIQEEKERVQSMNVELEKSRYQLAKINEVQNRWLEELSESEQSLREMNRSKDKFFSIISHDLKSPFFALVRYTDMMLQELEKLTSVEIKDYIAGINKSIKNVYDFVEDLLEWSRIQTGRIEFHPVYYELSAQIREVAHLNSGNFMKKNITLVNKARQKVYVFADENMVRSVLSNLISNAIKFTYEKGEIELGLAVKGNFAEVSVKDNGMGMSSDQVRILFMPEKRQLNRGTANERGTGLGLILCREFIEKNGGAISVESCQQKGSTFTFTLPLKEGPVKTDSTVKAGPVKAGAVKAEEEMTV